MVNLLSVKRKHPYFILILFNMGFLFLSDSKTSGIPFFRELFVFILLSICAWQIIIKRRWQGTFYEYWVLLLVGSTILLSPLLAWLSFGQPISYGMLEERRILHYLIFFPLFYGLLKKHITVKTIEKYIIFAFLACVALGSLYALQILQVRAGVSFQVEGAIEDLEDLYTGFRAGRFTFGSSFLGLVYLLAILNLRRLPYLFSKAAIKWMLLALVCVAYLWFVVQTRSMMAMLLLMTLVAFRQQLFRVVQLGYVTLFTLVLVIALFPDWAGQQVETFEKLYEEATHDHGPRVRDVTIQVIVDEIFNNNLVGMGALSLQWQGGFHQVYNRHFYLSDVGLYGIWYRFGLLAIPLIFFYFRNNLVWAFGRPDDKRPLVVAIRYSIVFALLNPVYSNIMTFGGQTYGLFFAVLAYLNLVEYPRLGKLSRESRFFNIRWLSGKNSS
ncbi:hypothetical protein [Endozoicomonas sp. ALE010]|uniref:hypothetical protein n=2 Tax=unclassified Endozoicomonas TaxID=2644528 RepID=UPI003BB77BAB